MRKLYLFIWLLLIGIADKTYGQSSLQLQWAFGAANDKPNAGSIKSNSIVTDAVGNRYITGSYELTADFDPSSEIFNLAATYFDLNNYYDSGDVFFAKYDS